MGRRSARMAAALGASALLASGCWGQLGAGPRMQFHNPYEYLLAPEVVDDLEFAWSTPGRAHLTFGNSLVVAQDGEIRALSVTDGAELWSTTVPTGAPVQGVRVSTIVTVGVELWVSWFGPLCTSGWSRLAAGTGQLLEESVAGSNEGRLFLNGSTDGVYGFSGVSPCSSPPSYVGAVFAPDTADARFTTSISTATFAFPALGSGRLFVLDGTVVESYAAAGCGASTCAPLWTVDVGEGGAHQLAVSDDGASVYVGLTTSEPTAVLRLDAATGVELGRMPLAGQLSAAFSVAGDTVVATAQGSVAAFDANCTGTCDPLWSADPPQQLTGPPITGAGVVHLPAERDVLSYAIDGCGQPTCDPLAELDVSAALSPTDVVNEILVASGRLFVDGYPSGGPTTTAYAPG